MAVASMRAAAAAKAAAEADREKRAKAVTLDATGRLVDASGKTIATSRVAVAKANQRLDSKQVFEEALSNAAAEAEREADNPYFDERVSATSDKWARKRRGLKFHEKGKFEAIAHEIRSKAQLERLQAEIAAAAKKSGIEAATKLAQLGPADRGPTANAEDVPTIEWWDAVVQPKQLWFDDGLDEFVARGLERDADEGAAERRAYQLINGDAEGGGDDSGAMDTAADGAVVPKAVSNERYGNRITLLIEHPVEVEPPREKAVAPVQIMLTKKERKKMRRQRRRAEHEEVQEKIRLGILPPPEPKVKLSNLMRVLGQEAVLDPTKVESDVRRQVAERLAKHNADNESRKLTAEERREKVQRKLDADKEKDTVVAVFRVPDLSDLKKRYKVDKNAEEWQLTGCVILHKGLNLIVCEGGPRAVRKYKHLLLDRIKWDDGHTSLTFETEEEHEDFDFQCCLVWEGSVVKRNFFGWKFKTCLTDQLARQFLKERQGIELCGVWLCRCGAVVVVVVVVVGLVLVLPSALPPSPQALRARVSPYLTIPGKIVCAFVVEHYWDLAMAQKLSAEQRK